MRNYLTETKWSAKQAARPAYILGLRDPQNGACYTWTDQSAAENTATPVIECDPATGEAKAEAYPVHVCKVVAKYVDINTEHFFGLDLWKRRYLFRGKDLTYPRERSS